MFFIGWKGIKSNADNILIGANNILALANRI